MSQKKNGVAITTTLSVPAKMTHFLVGTGFSELLVNMINWRDKESGVSGYMY